MLEDEAGTATDPEGFFRSGALVGGNKRSTSEGSFPLALLEKGGDVAYLVDFQVLSNGRNDTASDPIATENRIET